MASKVIDQCHVTLYTCTLTERGQGVASDDTWPFWLKKNIPHRGTVTETVIFDFVSTAKSNSFKCNYCTNIFVNQQGLSVHEKYIQSYILNKI